MTKIRDLVRKAWLRIIARAFGPQALAPEDLALVPEIVAQPQTVLDAAQHSGVQAIQGVQAGMQAEESARLAASREAGARLTDTVDRVTEHYLTAVRDTMGERLTGEVSPRGMALALRRATEDTTRDWDRVATTELQNAHNAGRVHAIKARDGGADPLVFKRPAGDACRHCLRLYLGPDGHPRVFRLSELSQDNVGRKKEAWLATRGATHPNCFCQLGHVPEGWGFDDESNLVPGGTGGIRYGADQLRKAIELEDSMQRAAHLGGDIDCCGFLVRVEANVGDVRLWRGGQTILRHAYGEIPGTVGMDGDAVDVYVGPDPMAPYAYLVDQLRPDGSYDEQKVMLGFTGPHEAEAAYRAHYPPSFFGGISQITVEELRNRLQQPGMVKARQPSLDDGGWTSHGGAGLRSAGEVKPQPQRPGQLNSMIEMDEQARELKERRPPLREIDSVGESAGIVNEIHPDTSEREEQLREDVDRNGRQLGARIKALGPSFLSVVPIELPDP